MTVSITDARREIDDLSAPYAFSDDDLNVYLSAGAGESSDELVLLYVKIRCWRAMLASAAKLGRYTEGATSVDRTKMFDNIKWLLQHDTETYRALGGSDGMVLGRQVQRMGRVNLTSRFASDAAAADDLSRNITEVDDEP
jgi:hypothetical protein